MRYFIVGIVSVLFTSVSFAQLDYPFSDGDTILTNEIEYVVGQGPQADGEPLRNGAAAIAEGLGGSDEGIYFDQIDSTQTAWDRTSSLISTLVNYALAIVGMVVLAYLLYHGFLALTAGSNSEQLTKGMQGIKYAFFALVGMGIAWFVISLILRFITLVTT